MHFGLVDRESFQKHFAVTTATSQPGFWQDFWIHLNEIWFGLAILAVDPDRYLKSPLCRFTLGKIFDVANLIALLWFLNFATRTDIDLTDVTNGFWLDWWLGVSLTALLIDTSQKVLQHGIADDLWTLIEILSILIYAASLIIRFGFQDQVWIQVMSYSGVGLTLKLLTVFSMTSWFGPIVISFAQMMVKVSLFAVIFISITFGFAGWFKVWFTNESYGADGAFDNWGGATVLLMEGMLGDFDTDTVSGGSQVMGRLIYAVYLVFMNLMILNILIAVVNEVYDKQHEVFGQEYWYNKAREALSLDWNDRVASRKEHNEERTISAFKDRIVELGRSLFQPNRLLSRGIENVMPLPPPLNLFALFIVPVDLVTGKQYYGTWSIGIFNIVMMWLVVLSILIIGFIALTLEFFVGLFFVWPVAIFIGIGQAGKRVLPISHLVFPYQAEGVQNKYLSDRGLKILQVLLAPFVVSVVVFVAFILLMLFTMLLVVPIVLTVPGLRLYKTYRSFHAEAKTGGNDDITDTGPTAPDTAAEIDEWKNEEDDEEEEEEEKKNDIPGAALSMSSGRQEIFNLERQEEKQLAAMLMNKAVCAVCSDDSSKYTSHPGRLRRAADKEV